MPVDIDALRVHKNGNPTVVIESEQKRGKKNAEAYINKVIALDNLWRSNRHEIDTLRKQRTLLTKNIRDKVKANLSANSEKENSKILGKTISEKERKMKEYETLRNDMLNKIGNILDKRVPVAENNTDLEIKRWGDDILEDPNSYLNSCSYAADNNNNNNNTDDNIVTTKKKKKKGEVASTGIENLLKNKRIKSHLDLCNVVNGIEAERGTSVAGKRGYFLRGPLVVLKMALERYAMDFLCNKKMTNENENDDKPTAIFEPIYTPFFIEPMMMHATSQLDEFDEMVFETKNGTLLHAILLYLQHFQHCI
jgi:seryl-tRNA synthetase